MRRPALCAAALPALLAAAVAHPSGAPGGADVLRAEASGSPGAYRFTVSVRSPDAGCARFASFWEVLRADGSLAYRRVLRHSHVDEQPFTREGGPVPVAADEEIVVRAHLHPDGYGGAMLRGTVAGGLRPWTDAPAGFAPAPAGAPPAEPECAY
jgi:hypothetical protein